LEDTGILLLAAAEQRPMIAERLAAGLEAPPDPDRVRHGLADMIRCRAPLLAAGYPDSNACEALCSNPPFKTVVARLSTPHRCPQYCHNLIVYRAGSQFSPEPVAAAAAEGHNRGAHV
jgi:hypothetical protein